MVDGVPKQDLVVRAAEAGVAAGAIHRDRLQVAAEGLFGMHLDGEALAGGVVAAPFAALDMNADIIKDLALVMDDG